MRALVAAALVAFLLFCFIGCTNAHNREADCRSRGGEDVAGTCYKLERMP